MSINLKHVIVLAGLLLLPVDKIHASCGTTENRPKVGLALSGGGARGAAHVGVLQQLEALRIPVDCIAGTSIGAIIGGLYASGMSSEDIQAFVRRIDWQDALSDQPPRRDLTFRRKQDDRGFLIDFKLGLRNGQFILPRGLLQGQKQNQLLRSATLPVSGIHDFDRLPIPFRALATDIENGESVTLSRGNLAVAIQASMSVPGVFAPREIGGRLLVDGGITQNMPISVVRNMGADIVIAVDVAEPLVSREELSSSFDVANQMLTILMQQRSRQEIDSLSGNDVLVQPTLDARESGDFSNLDEVVQSGAEATLMVRTKLERLSMSNAAYADYTSKRRQARPGNPVIDYVTVASNSRLAPEVIEQRVRASAGQSLDQATLERDIAGLYGLDTFEQVDYEIISEGEKTGLEIRANAKSWGPSFLDFGMNLEEDFEGASNYTIAARYTRAEINSLGGEWRIDTQLGQRARFFSEFYQPLDIRTRYFIAPQLEIARTNVNVFENNERTAEYRVSSAEVRLEVGRNFSNWGEARLGVRRSQGQAERRVGDPALPELDFDSGGLFASFSLDRLDDPGFPTSGQLGSISWQAERESFGADLDSDILRLNWLGANTWGRHTLLSGLRFASAVDDQLALQNTFNLGGLFRLSGYSADELAGRQLALASLIYYQQIAVGRMSALDLPVYLGGSVEAGNVWQDRDEVGIDDLRLAGSFFVGVDTPLGPVYLAFGMAEGGARAGYFYLGQTF